MDLGVPIEEILPHRPLKCAMMECGPRRGEDSSRGAHPELEKIFHPSHMLQQDVQVPSECPCWGPRVVFLDKISQISGLSHTSDLRERQGVNFGKTAYIIGQLRKKYVGNAYQTIF